MGYPWLWKGNGKGTEAENGMCYGFQGVLDGEVGL